MTDIEVYNTVDIDDLWVYDKLILTRKLGYYANPAGIPPIKPDWYMVKPITNLDGMGIGSRKRYLTPKSYEVEHGKFYMSYFEGAHLSVDYLEGEFLFAVRGIKKKERFQIWERVSDEPDIPDVLKPIVAKYKNVNIEYIGDKVIEVHLRYNPDFYGRAYNRIQVVYDPFMIKDSFVWDEEVGEGFKRYGFNILE